MESKHVKLTIILIACCIGLAIAVTVLLLRPAPTVPNIEIELSKQRVKYLESLIKEKESIISDRNADISVLKDDLKQDSITIRTIRNKYYYEKNRIHDLPIDSNIRILTDGLSEENND